VALPTIGDEGFLPDVIAVTNSARMYTLVYDYPLYNDEKKDEPIPGLVKKFEYSKDNLTLTLYLREGIPFHEGWGK